LGPKVGDYQRAKEVVRKPDIGKKEVKGLGRFGRLAKAQTKD